MKVLDKLEVIKEIITEEIGKENISSSDYTIYAYADSLSESLNFIEILVLVPSTKFRDGCTYLEDRINPRLNDIGASVIVDYRKIDTRAVIEL